VERGEGGGWRWVRVEGRDGRGWRMEMGEGGSIILCSEIIIISLFLHANNNKICCGPKLSLQDTF